jgi:hypothetical protein
LSHAVASADLRELFERASASHNLQNARAVFGAEHVEQKVRASERVLCQLGFPRRNATGAIGRACASEPDLKAEQLLRKSLLLLVRAPS